MSVWGWSILLPFVAAATLLAEGAPSPSIAVFLHSDGKTVSRVMEAMKTEVSTLLATGGLKLEFRSLAERAKAESFADVYVLRLTGKCHMDGLNLLFSELGPYGDAVVLGESYTADQQVQPFGSIACDALRRTVAARTAALTRPEREHAFGRALGRVMAHELYHMITRQPGHAAGGVFKASYRAHNLLDVRFDFDEAEQEQLRRIAVRLGAN